MQLQVLAVVRPSRICQFCLGVKQLHMQHQYLDEHDGMNQPLHCQKLCFSAGENSDGRLHSIMTYIVPCPLVILRYPPSHQTLPSEIRTSLTILAS